MRTSTTFAIAALLAAAPAIASGQSASAAGRPPARLAQLSDDLAAVVARAAPAVVQISVIAYAGLTGETGGGAAIARQRAGGSGVILHPDGYILTNAHVVSGARRIRVRLPPAPADPRSGSIVRPPGRSLDATIVGLDAETDLAVLKVEARDLPVLTLADSDDLRPGHLVLAFGNPLGLDQSVSVGVVSAVGRQRTADDPMVYIQTDAPINPGSSGGPLLDMAGRVVGINTFILSESGGSDGLGFAVPSNIARTVFEQLRTTGVVRRGTLGIAAQTITPAFASGLRLTRAAGVIVADVVEGGPGDLAGLQPGDMILTLDGKPMENARQLEVNLYGRRVGDVVELEVDRGGTLMKTSAAIRERPNDPGRFGGLVTLEDHLVAPLGILALEIDPALAAQLPQLRAPRGILVAARAQSAPSAEAGLLPGDVVIALNGAGVGTLAEFRDAVGRIEPGGACVLQVQRGERLMYVVVEIE
ncbi:MAG TPA: trypsin-like peptidase domain-containing protein [Vicinamibacterales bacterium]